MLLSEIPIKVVKLESLDLGTR